MVDAGSHNHVICSEMPAVVLEVTVSHGQAIRPGDQVALLESMKMEIPVIAEIGGYVVAMPAIVGQPVAAYEPLIHLGDKPATSRASAPSTLETIAYLGPDGTFTHQALCDFAPTARHVPLPSVELALNEVLRGEVDAAMVPVENSVEGGVTATIDSLAASDGLQIVGEHLLPITFVIATKSVRGFDDVRSVGTHPHAWAQVRKYVSAKIPVPHHIPTASTAAAAEALSNGSADFDAVVCTEAAARERGLSILARDVADNRSAETRFLLVARSPMQVLPSGRDKTCLVIYQRQDQAGGLAEILTEFSSRGVNLRRVDSRPTGHKMGAYSFSIDLDGHVADRPVAEALNAVQRVARGLKLLGSYPAASSSLTCEPVAGRSTGPP